MHKSPENIPSQQSHTVKTIQEMFGVEATKLISLTDPVNAGVDTVMANALKNYFAAVVAENDQQFGAHILTITNEFSATNDNEHLKAA